MRVLVTGGAGYVGSTSTERLLDAGHEVVVYDSMLRGHRAAVPEHARLVQGELENGDQLAQTFRDNGIEAVLHCAAVALVGESVTEPDLYFRNNVVGGLSLLDAMRAADVRRIVYSSSCAVYGVPVKTPLTEDHPQRPINPYGETKRQVEGMLNWYAPAYGMSAVSLRYFNVAGATETRGEDHRPETHLIPNVLAAAEGGPHIKVFGTDYPTPDGTCIRDYIHVDDLARAHIAALELTADGAPEHRTANLGTGSGFSVLEVLRAAETVVGREIPHELGPRRPGDPPVLVASNDYARELLGWEPRSGSLEEIIGSAWRWRQANPDGYAAVG